MKWHLPIQFILKGYIPLSDITDTFTGGILVRPWPNRENATSIFHDLDENSELIRAIIWLGNYRDMYKNEAD